MPDITVMEMGYYTKASGYRKDIKSMELRSENAKKGIQLAEADFFPSVGIGGSYQLNDHRYPLGSEGDSWQVMAYLRWHLFDGMKWQYEKAKAKHHAVEMEEQLKGLKNFVSYRVYEAYLAVEEAKKNIEFSREALKTAEEGRRLVKIRYETAFSPIVDLLDAQVVNDRARVNLVARENEYRLAIINLAYESGTILADLKIESE
jgi:outer membrane protein TolC